MPNDETAPSWQTAPDTYYVVTDRTVTRPDPQPSEAVDPDAFRCLECGQVLVVAHAWFLHLTAERGRVEWDGLGRHRDPDPGVCFCDRDCAWTWIQENPDLVAPWLGLQEGRAEQDGEGYVVVRAVRS